MRVLALMLLAACELQPAPKKQVAPPPPTAVEPAQPATAPPADAGVVAAADAGAKIEITAPCLEVAAKLAQLVIDLQQDPGAKSNAEQARADMTRKMGEACTVQPWTEDQRKCYLAAKSEPDVRACEQRFPAPQQAAPAKPTPPAPPGAVQ